MSSRRYLTLTEEAQSIIDAQEGVRPGDWLSSLIIDYHATVNGLIPYSGCGELAEIVPALRLVAKQNALILDRLSKLTDDPEYDRRLRLQDVALQDDNGL